jgi:hypothetical protein
MSSARVQACRDMPGHCPATHLLRDSALCRRSALDDSESCSTVFVALLFVLVVVIMIVLLISYDGVSACVSVQCLSAVDGSRSIDWGHDCHHDRLIQSQFMCAVAVRQ